MKKPVLVSTAQIARAAGCTAPNVRYWVRAGKAPEPDHVYTADRWLWTRPVAEEVVALLRSQMLRFRPDPPPNQYPPPELTTGIGHAARVAGVTPYRLRCWLNSGQIPGATVNTRNKRWELTATSVKAARELAEANKKTAT